MASFDEYKIIGFTYGRTTDRLLSQKTLKAKGEHLQIEATNTVGKSMSIQTIIQAIKPISDVAKPFLSIYKRKGAIYSLVQWILDDRKTKLIVGIGFERKANVVEENENNRRYEKYQYFSFTILSPDELHINLDNIPFQRKTVSGNVVINSVADSEKWLKDLQSKYGKNRVGIFGNSSQGRKDFKEKLLEYGISQDEWTDVIIKLNNDNKEGGLSEFLKEHKTVEKLMQNSIIPIIESTLTSEGEESQIVVLRQQIEKCLKHVLEMQEKLKQHQNFLLIKDYISEIEKRLVKVIESNEEIDEVKNQLYSLYNFIKNKKKAAEEEVFLYGLEREKYKRELGNIDYENNSNEYWSYKYKADSYKETEESLKEELLEENFKKEELEENLNILKYRDYKERLGKEVKAEIAKKAEIEVASENSKEITKRLKQFGGNIHRLILEDMELNKVAEEKNINDLKENRNKQEGLKEEGLILQRKENEFVLLNQEISIKKTNFNERFNNYKREHDDVNEYISTNFLGKIVNYKDYILKIQNVTVDTIKAFNEEDEEIKKNGTEIQDSNKKIRALAEEKVNLENKIKVLEEREKVVNKLIDDYEKINELYSFGVSLESADLIIEAIHRKKEQFDNDKEELLKRRSSLITELKNMEELNYINISILDELRRNKIEPIEGFKYLMNMETSLEYKMSLIDKNPLLPHSIIVTEGEYNKLKSINLIDNATVTIPILIRSEIDNPSFTKFNNLNVGDGINLLTSFNSDILDPIERLRIISKIKENINFITKDLKYIKKEEGFLTNFEVNYTNITVNSDDLEIGDIIKEYKIKVVETKNSIENIERRITELEERNTKLNKNKESLISREKELNSKLDKIQSIQRESNIVNDNDEKKEYNDKELLKLKNLRDTIEEKLKYIELEKEHLVEVKLGIEKLKNDLLVELSIYKNYDKIEDLSYSKDELIIKYNEYSMQGESRNINKLNKELIEIQRRMKLINGDINKILKKLKKDGYKEKIIYFSEEELEKSINSSGNRINELNNEASEVASQYKVNNALAYEKAKFIFSEHNGLSPADIKDIKDFNFTGREDKVLKDLKDVELIIENSDKLSKDLELELRSLNSFNDESKAITYEPKDVFEESKKLQKALNTAEELFNLLVSEYREALLELEDFNRNNNFAYKNYTESLIPYRSVYGKQKVQLENILLVVNEEINKVEKYSEQIEVEKTLISEGIKDYVRDFISELKIINKLGRFRGDELFNIKLPNDEVILNSLSLVDIMIDELVNEPNLENIKLTINTYYILNKILNIANIPVSIITYELNNKSGHIKWADISHMTTGAQRFSIAFIVTVILLEYKRYENNSEFKGNSHKSKVLLIDNPFGETSEGSILKELFALADKFNVQIISYSHVTNDSVRRNFKRIYAMTVEKTSNDKEFVELKEMKYSDEDVAFSTFKIGEREAVEQKDMFSLIE